jgi:hypothetical protein
MERKWAFARPCISQAREESTYGIRHHESIKIDPITRISFHCLLDVERERIGRMHGGIVGQRGPSVRKCADIC